MNPRAAKRYARRNRAATLVCVGAYLACSRALWPDDASRASWHFVLVLSFGYGHLFGSAAATFWPPRARRLAALASNSQTLDVRPARGFAQTLRDLGGLALITTAPLVYSTIVNGNPLGVVAMLAVATWHTVENDAAFVAWYRNDFRAPRLGRDPVRHAGVIGTTLIVMGLSAASLQSASGPAIHSGLRPELAAGDLRLCAGLVGALLASRRSSRARRSGCALLALAVALPWRPDALFGMTFADFFAASTLHHLVSWSIALVDRIRGGRAPGLARRLAIWHLTPIGVAAVALFAPFGWRAELASVFFSPALYLYLALLHVGQTLASRARPPG